MPKREPVYQSILAELKRRILDGAYPEGTQVPTEQEWARSFGVSRITSRNALDQAARQGLIDRYPGRGSFVRKGAQRILSQERRGKHRVIGIIQPDLSDTFGLEFFRHLQSLTHEEGMLTTTGISKDSRELENELISEFLDAGVEGMVVKPVHNETFNNQILQLIIDGYPIVLLDRYLRDVSCANVVSDNIQGAYKGMSYLYSLGHRQIGVLSRPIGTTTALLDRQQGVMQAVMEHGARLKEEWFLRDLPDDTEHEPEEMAALHRRVRTFLTDHPEVTALFCLKHVFVPTVELVAHELGRSIPEELSLISFDSPIRSSRRIKPLTHLRQNERQMAQEALAALKKAMNGDRDRTARTVPVDLVIGETTAAAPGRGALTPPPPPSAPYSAMSHSQ
ncbi:MAG: GntR family transcriptional regulator [Spirochaetaceae bacterium]